MSESNTFSSALKIDFSKYPAILPSRLGNNTDLLYGSASQGLETTKFTNLIGWNGYWPRSWFSHLDQHLDRECFEAKKWQTKMWLLWSKNIYFCKCQTADEKKSEENELTLEELNSAHRRSQPKWKLVQTSYLKRSCVQTSLRSVCTFDLGQDSPIQTDLARLIRAKYSEYTFPELDVKLTIHCQ